MSLKVTPYDHQEVGAALMDTYEDLGIFCDMGTGKTLMAMLACVEECRKGGDCLVVAPASVVPGWLSKASDYFDGSDLKAILEHMQVVSYETLRAHPERYDRRWDVLVLDEGHYIKTAGAKRSKACRWLATKAKRRYILTGTPTSNGQLCNLWSEFCFLQPKAGRRTGDTQSAIWEPFCGSGSYTAWIKRFAHLNQWHQPDSYWDVEIIQQVMAEHSYRITKKDCLSLPEVLPDEIVRVPVADRDAYKRLAKSGACERLGLLCNNALTRSLALRQLCSGFVTVEGRQVDSKNDPKRQWLKQFIGDWDRKLVVFCNFRRSVDVCAEEMRKAGMRPVVLDGRQTDKGAWLRFQDDPKVRGIVCQYQSGNAGIDLTAASTVLFYEPTPSSNLNQQARDRVHRVGQTEPVQYLYLCGERSIELSMHAALSRYMDFSEALFTEHMEECSQGRWR